VKSRLAKKFHHTGLRKETCAVLTYSNFIESLRRLRESDRTLRDKALAALGADNMKQRSTSVRSVRIWDGVDEPNPCRSENGRYGFVKGLDFVYSCINLSASQ
jgi:hypothetical protein